MGYARGTTKADSLKKKGRSLKNGCQGEVGAGFLSYRQTKKVYYNLKAMNKEVLLLLVPAVLAAGCTKDNIVALWVTRKL